MSHFTISGARKCGIIPELSQQRCFPHLHVHYTQPKMEPVRIPYTLKEPCADGCKMTWQMYHIMHVNHDWDITTTICHGVYEHPHLSNELIVDRHGISFDYPIHWIVGDMCSDNDAPNGKTRMDVLAHVINHGADVNNQITDEMTPLMVAIDVKVFAYLLSKGADVNKRCMSGNILHARTHICKVDTIATIWHFPGVASLAHEKNNDGKTPLECMSKYERKEYPHIVQLLESKGNLTKRAT